MISRIVSTRVASRHLVSRINGINSIASPMQYQSRSLSSLDKLKSALEEYKEKNYSQCIPSRFKKDIVCAAKEKETEHVVIEGLQKVVANIGGAQQVSRHDLETIFSEVGSSDGRISCEQMMKLL